MGLRCGEEWNPTTAIYPDGSSGAELGCSL